MGYTYIYIAFHFRDYGDPADPGANKHQACYKTFRTEADTVAWLKSRINKSATSPKGTACFTICSDWSVKKIDGYFKFTEVLSKMVNGKCFCDNLKKGLQAYLTWHTRLMKLKGY